jgi:hypothetical protein
MNRKLYRFLAAIAASILLSGMGLVAAGTATASTTPDATFYSTDIAGSIAAGTTRLGDVRVVVENLPNLSAVTCPSETSAPCVEPDTLVIGDVLAQTTNGGIEYGMGLVWDNVASGCLSDQWVVESGHGSGLTAGQVIPADDLSPVSEFSGPICLNPGGSQAIETYESTGHHETIFEAGDSVPDEQVVGSLPCDTEFFAAGKGVFTGGQVETAALPLGFVAQYGASGLTELSGNRDGSHQTRITFASITTFAVDATETGGTPSTSDPLTLVPEFSGPGSGSTVSVP